MKINKLFFVSIIRNLLALFLIFSALMKLQSIETFELYIYSFKYISFNIASIFALLIISVELSIGIMLILNTYTRYVIIANIILILIFTVYLIYLFIIGSSENCYCMGSEFDLNPKESIIKNIIIIAMSYFIFIKNKAINFKYSKIISVFALLVFFSLPLIIKPPDFLFQSRYQKSYNSTFNLSEIEDISEQNQINVTEGKKIICFFSMSCVYCKHSAQKLSLISKKSKNKFDIVYVFYGSENNLTDFWEESKSIKFPYVIIPTKIFFGISGKSLPSIFFIENGKMKKNIGYRNINENEIIKFFEKSK